MLNKGQIISSALRSLGEVKEYNNNNYQIYQVAESIFPEVELEISNGTILSRNLVYRELNKSTLGTDPENRTIFVLPVDVINVVRLVSQQPFDIVGENLHTYGENCTALCNIKIRLEEQNELYFGIYKWLLCIKLIEAYDQYKKYTEYAHTMYEKEQIKINNMFMPTAYDYAEKNDLTPATHRGGSW